MPPTDPIRFVVVVAVLLAVATIVCFVPARRATGIDPITALHTT